MRHLSPILLLALVASGCIAGGSAGTLQTGPLQGVRAGETADVSVERRGYVVGTAFDFRAVRVVSSLEMVQRERAATWSPGITTDRSSVEAKYQERRVMRLDVPLLTLWNLKGGGLGYPGILPNRHTIDLWARGGTSDILQFDNGGFGGAALTYYRAGSFAVSLTVDRWSEPTSVRGLNAEGYQTYEGDAGGWVMGLEVTLAAGEYALTAFEWLVDRDDDARNIRRADSLRLPWQSPAEAGASD